MKITKKKHLEIKLQKILPHSNPKIELEQYSTPSKIASDLLWNAFSLGDIAYRKIADLGCGTGIFTIGSALLGAESAIGFDIDEEAIKVANKNLLNFDIDNVYFNVFDVLNNGIDLEINTVFQNPPFGSQKNAQKGIDLKFIKNACNLYPNVIYSFHMASTEEFIIDYFEKLDFKVSHVFKYFFPIPRIYDFHRNESKDVEVCVIRAIFQ